MKKAIVLLTTIMFILAISTLIIKNLKDIEKFVDTSNDDFINIQILISMLDVKNQVLKLLEKHKSDVDESLENGLSNEIVRVEHEKLNIGFSLKKYDRLDIYKLKDEKDNSIENLFIENNIYEFNIFKLIFDEIINQKKKNIESYKQLNDMIITFYERTYNENVFLLSELLGFISDENLYELNIEVSFFEKKSKGYYILKNDGTVKYFDFSYK